MHKLLSNLIKRNRLLFDMITKYLHENKDAMNDNLMKKYRAYFDQVKSIPFMSGVDRVDDGQHDEGKKRGDQGPQNSGLIKQIVDIGKCERIIGKFIDEFINDSEIQNIFAFNKSTVITEKSEIERASINKLWDLYLSTYSNDPEKSVYYENMLSDVCADDVYEHVRQAILDGHIYKIVRDLYKKLYKGQDDLPEIIKAYVLLTGLKSDNLGPIEDELAKFRLRQQSDKLEANILSRKNIYPVTNIINEWAKVYAKLGVYTKEKEIIMIERDVGEYVEFNYLPLFNKDYISEHKLEITENTGLNGRVLKKMQTAIERNYGGQDKSKVVCVEATPNGPKILEGAKIKHSSIIIESFTGRAYRLLKYNFRAKDIWRPAFNETPIRPSLYNKVLQDEILEHIKYPKHRRILYEYNEYKVEKLDELEIRNKLFYEMVKILKAELDKATAEEFNLYNYFISKTHIDIIEREISDITNLYVYSGKIASFDTEAKMSFLCNANIIMGVIMVKLQTVLYGFDKDKKYKKKPDIIFDYESLTNAFLDQLMAKPSIFLQIHLKYKEFFLSTK